MTQQSLPIQKVFTLLKLHVNRKKTLVWNRILDFEGKKIMYPMPNQKGTRAIS